MKKLITLVFLMFFGIVNSQGLDFDPDFKAYLLTYTSIDSNSDGEIDQSEADYFTSLVLYDYPDREFSSVKGIEYFTYLEGFTCYARNIFVFDLSKNSNLKTVVARSLTGSVNLSGLAFLSTADFINSSITSIDVSGCTSLETLFLHTNKLSSLALNDLPELINVYCANNEITNLTISNNPKLKGIYCSNNKLTTLDISNNLPNLESINCSKNLLTSLDVTKNEKLKSISCENNQLTSLDISKNTQLSYLKCYRNQFQTLDLSNSPVSTLNFAPNSNLETLFIKNGVTTTSAYFSDANGDEILFVTNFGGPGLDKLKFICADDFEIDGITQEMNKFGYSNVAVNEYCTFSPGGNYFTIKGQVKQTSGECFIGGVQQGVPVPYLKLTVTDVTNGQNNPGLTITKTTDQNGNYSIDVPEGSYQVIVINPNPDFFDGIPLQPSQTFPNPENITVQTTNYCLKTKASAINVKKSEITIIPLGIARPGFDASYKIIYKNVGPTVIPNAFVELNFDDAVMDFTTASITPNTTTTGNLVWNVSNLNPFETREIIATFNLNTPTEVPALDGGDGLSFKTFIKEDVSVFNPNVDAMSGLSERVTNAYDPNDKVCLEGEELKPENIGAFLNYRIRFENTGTANATNVVVKDMIDTTKLDINTLEIVGASHNMVTKISNNNKVEFIFENIDLPFDDANNDGYVVFKIKTVPTLVVGDKVSNTANIYFDYNFPIDTKEAVSEIKDPSLSVVNFNGNDYFTVSPNPANDILNIQKINAIDIDSAVIYSLLGQEVMRVNNPESSINMSGLKSGSYVLKLTTNKGVSTTKIIKL
jgi:hypothetical protein